MLSDAITKSFIPSKAQIDYLQAEMVKLPQADLQTEHYFSEGMYCRKVFRPAGTVIVGKIHKKPHFFLCAKGEIIAWTESGMRTLRAGDIVESKPGTKRVTYATEDSIGITFHKTDNTDLDEIEAELIEPDDTALFDSSNNIKQFVIEAQRALKGE
jgi:quercetin dioxygenase-like cupin family protein